MNFSKLNFEHFIPDIDIFLLDDMNKHTQEMHENITLLNGILAKVNQAVIECLTQNYNKPNDLREKELAETKDEGRKVKKHNIRMFGIIFILAVIVFVVFVTNTCCFSLGGCYEI